MYSTLKRRGNVRCFNVEYMWCVCIEAIKIVLAPNKQIYTKLQKGVITINYTKWSETPFFKVCLTILWLLGVVVVLKLHFPEKSFHKITFRGVFRTLSRIYDGDFLGK